jgi:phosphoesterase RecJ-like protein
LDSGKLSHVSKNELFKVPSTIKSVNIDHHITNDYFGDLNYVYQLGSNCTVLYQFFNELNVILDFESMNILSIGIITDTGFFKNDSLTSLDLNALGQLMEKGVQIWDLVTRLSNYEPYDQIKYKELVYKNTIVNFEKKFAYSFVKKEEVEKMGIDLGKVYVRHSDLLKYIVGIDFAFAISDINDQPGTLEVSFRTSSKNVDVSKFAQAFGGGGHKGAAGCLLTDNPTFEQALQLVLQKLDLK